MLEINSSWWWRWWSWWRWWWWWWWWRWPLRYPSTWGTHLHASNISNMTCHGSPQLRASSCLLGFGIPSGWAVRWWGKGGWPGMAMACRAKSPLIWQVLAVGMLREVSKVTWCRQRLFLQIECGKFKGNLTIYIYILYIYIEFQDELMVQTGLYPDIIFHPGMTCWNTF